jgi:hypothetical protein
VALIVGDQSLNAASNTSGCNRKCCTSFWLEMAARVRRQVPSPERKVPDSSELVEGKPKLGLAVVPG